MSSRIICMGITPSPGIALMELLFQDSKGVKRLLQVFNQMPILTIAKKYDQAWWLVAGKNPKPKDLEELVKQIEQTLDATCQYHRNGKPTTKDEWIAHMSSL